MLNVCLQFISEVFIGEKLMTKKFSHYTNIEGLRGMLSSRKFQVSRGDQMNDKQELTKGDMRIWSNIYLASFSYGEEENMAM